MLRPFVELAATAALLLGLVLPAAAPAQVLDPDPTEPNAQQLAAARYQLAQWGLMPPPVGWDCWQAIPDVSGPTFTHCEPDPLLVDEQERERREWERRRDAFRDAIERRFRSRQR